jgi:hypothetical protein
MPVLAPVLRPLVEVVEEVPGWGGMTEMVAVWVTGAGAEVEDNDVSGGDSEDIGEDNGCVSFADGVGVGVGVEAGVGVEVEGSGVVEWDADRGWVVGVEVFTVGGVEDVTTGTTTGLEVVEETTDGTAGGEVVLIPTTGHCDVQ